MELLGKKAKLDLGEPTFEVPKWGKTLANAQQLPQSSGNEANSTLLRRGEAIRPSKWTSKSYIDGSCKCDFDRTQRRLLSSWRVYFVLKMITVR